jgi:hypothetical protein
METEKLPNDCNDILFVSINEILTANAWNLQTKLLGNFDDLTTIDTFLKCVIGILIDNFPVNTTGFQFV